MTADSQEEVIVVNEADQPIASAVKLDAHIEGLLHRAFSVLVFNGQGETLLQKRAATKYHSAGLWANSCCGHPRPGESAELAACRRLKEELGIECDLSYGFTFRYRAQVPPDLIENEIDHVFFARFDGLPQANQQEVGEWRWAAMEDLRQELAGNPQTFAAWVPLLFAEFYKENRFRFGPVISRSKD